MKREVRENQKKGSVMQKTKNIRTQRKAVKGPRKGARPFVGIKLNKERIDAIDRKAKEYGGLSRTDVIRMALKKYGL